MQNPKIQHSFDDLYDSIRGEKEEFIDEEAFTSKVAELIGGGYIETSLFEDVLLYSAKSGLQWSGFVHMEDTIKKEILLLLVENPTTFFVLQNTQKGKMRIASLELKQWGQSEKKVVAFLIVDNDTTLADQSVDGVMRTFGSQGVRIFPLSSTSKTRFEDIKTYIDAYAAADHGDPDYPMPLIALLANVKQCEKMIKLLNHIHMKVTLKGSNLRYGMIWDEADKTYPSLRDKQITIDDLSVSCGTFILQKNAGLHRLGFVTATDGDLLDEDYPECANAYLYQADIAPEDQQHYRALHHAEAVTHTVGFARHTHNSYAMHILEEKHEHFMTPIVLPTGEVYYRKTIVNSNGKTAEMKDFAVWCKGRGITSLVYNGFGGTSVKVYGEGIPEKSYKTKGKRFNQLLFYLYKKLNLHTKPLMIIGRRKVDRGLGFHYCPRSAETVEIPGDLGVLVTGGKEGLVWTDEILGKIVDKNTAVQKAGRLAGIIGDSPQYPGSITFWTDAATEKLIRDHNTVVDAANTYKGVSARQAVKSAKDAMPPEEQVNHEVPLDSFLVYKDEATVRKVCEALGYQHRFVAPMTREGFADFKKEKPMAHEEDYVGFRLTSLNTVTDKVSLHSAIQHVPSSYGTQPADKEGEDITKRKHAYVKIKKGLMEGKFGLLQRKEGDTYYISLKGVVNTFERSAFSMIVYRTCYPCYRDVNDKESLHFVIIVRPDTDLTKLAEVKATYPSIIVPQKGAY